MNPADIPVLILAAGRSQRFGSIKALANYRGQSLLGRCLDQIRPLNPEPYLALGAYREQIRRELDGMLRGVSVVEVTDWQDGMSASLKAGIARIQMDEPESSGVLVFLGDQPKVDTGIVKRFMETIQVMPDAIIAADYGGKPGVPAYLPKRIWERMSELKGDQGAGKVIASLPHHLIEIGSAGEDVDTPEDLARIQGQD